MELTICVGSSCHLKGSRDVIKILERLISLHRLEDKITLKGSFCMGECSKNGVCVCVDSDRFNVAPLNAELFFNDVILKRIN
ncbi:MAG: (2Fe-2S) ferredoxin domain-containing protein [Clostridiales bacterium]|nr:(2Fe-2S) ferredoxin domain-containing protein [Clostridiales bacterium]